MIKSIFFIELTPIFPFQWT